MDHLPASETEIKEFVELLNLDKRINQRLDTIKSDTELNEFLFGLGSSLSCSLIPLEQAKRPAKILLSSGITKYGKSWRILQCPGGPFVLQVICQNYCFALWLQEC
jgi:hypothetical protein